MPLFDFECECGKVQEVLTDYKTEFVPCGCGKQAKKIISWTGVFTANQDAPWIRSVCDVVDKKSNKPHVLEMLKNPTRRNYHEWMKKEGVRPLENSEPINKHNPKEFKASQKKAMLRKYQERNSLTVSGI